MADTWDEVAHTAIADTTNPITADATDIAKYGAPSVAVVTAVLTAILGAAWKVDPSRPAVLFSTAIIVAAVVLGVYLAFSTDIRTRGAVTVARLDAIERLADTQARTSQVAVDQVEEQLKGALTWNRALLDQLQKSQADLQAATNRLDAANARVDALVNGKK